jgi:hypothetical protein
LREVIRMHKRPQGTAGVVNILQHGTAPHSAGQCSTAGHSTTQRAHLLELLFQPHILLLISAEGLARGIAGEGDVLEDSRHLHCVVQVGKRGLV